MKSSNPDTVRGVIPAAGRGARMRRSVPKQYLPLLGKPIIQHTIEKLLAVPAVGALVVALADDDQEFNRIRSQWRGRVTTVVGGAERCHSVLAGLKFLSRTDPPDTWVLVHDAARPCVRPSDVRDLISAVGSHPAGGILAVPVRDTMKRADARQQIAETVDRDGLWHALTPQMFRLGDLMNAIEDALEADVMVTDEAQAMERIGKRPLLVQGHADNIKVTAPEDCALAELYLRNQIQDTTQCA